MRIQILRRTSIAGRPLLPGDVVEASDADARYLMARGKAAAATEVLPVVVEPLANGARKPRQRKPVPV